MTAASGWEYLRTLAVSRLFLDSVTNIQASWVTQGAKVGQVALAFGANDMGSTMIEENVVAAAGTKFMLAREELVRLVARRRLHARAARHALPRGAALLAGWLSVARPVPDRARDGSA